MGVKRRVGGLRVDPAVEAWQEQAATNVAALSKKQKQDRERVRVKYDLPGELKERIETAATGERTSASQFAAFLLNWAMGIWDDEGSATGGQLRRAVYEAKTPSKSMRIDWNLEIR